MYIEMVCGQCESYFNIDAEEEDKSVLLMMMHRFANAHVECGYMTQMVQDDDPQASVRKKVIKPRFRDQIEEESEGT
jgi:hypothetical protein